MLELLLLPLAFLHFRSLLFLAESLRGLKQLLEFVRLVRDVLVDLAQVLVAAVGQLGLQGLDVLVLLGDHCLLAAVPLLALVQLDADALHLAVFGEQFFRLLLQEQQFAAGRGQLLTLPAQVLLRSGDLLAHETAFGRHEFELFPSVLDLLPHLLLLLDGPLSNEGEGAGDFLLEAVHVLHFGTLVGDQILLEAGEALLQQILAVVDAADLRRQSETQGFLPLFIIIP